MKYLNPSYFIFLLFSFLSIQSQTIAQPTKGKQTSVYDFAEMLDNEEKLALRQKLINYADSTSTQIVVVTINSLKGNYIASYAVELAQEWGIGQKNHDNGAIILVSKKDKKITIQNGYGLEEYLTDYHSKIIIDKIMQPEFKKGNFYAGFDKATDAIILLLSGKFNAKSLEASRKETPIFFKLFGIFVTIFFVILFLKFISRTKNNRDNGRKGGKKHTSPSLFDILVLSSMGSSRSSGSFGGGSSSGGFSGGFGGGGFGGGGAVGGW